MLSERIHNFVLRRASRCKACAAHAVAAALAAATVAAALAGIVAPALAADVGAPATAQRPVIDSYHGVSVSDPYRWLEDSPTRKSATGARRRTSAPAAISTT